MLWRALPLVAVVLAAAPALAQMHACFTQHTDGYCEGTAPGTNQTCLSLNKCVATMYGDTAVNMQAITCVSGASAVLFVYDAADTGCASATNFDVIKPTIGTFVC